MWKLVALAACCALVLAVPFALVSEGNPTASAAGPACTPLKQIYSEQNWQDPTPLDGRIACRPATRKGARHTIDHFRLWRRYRQVAPYAGLNEGDKWLRYLPVPAYIVQCETNGYYGQGRWSAANSSGAQGPAQLLGWGAPYPANTPREKVRYWEVARHVLSVQGLSAWACA